MFVYEADGDLVDRMGGFLDDGAAAGDALLVVVAGDKWELLSNALGRTGGTVRHFDPDAVYSTPAAAVATYDATLRQLRNDGVGAVRAYAELPTPETEEEADEWVSYEAIVNRALAAQPMWVVCGYDTRRQTTSAVVGGMHAHRRVLTDGWHVSPLYNDDPAPLLRRLASMPESLPPLPAIAVDGDARAIRARLAVALHAGGVSDERVPELLVAANEIVANAIQHGSGPSAMRAGRTGERFVIEVSDSGPGLEDPLAGYLPPRTQSTGAAGLWIARQLASRVELISNGDGLTVRLWD
jgi:anti-sigma regulatory factor (Ser/Thr protein kinase)